MELSKCWVTMAIRELLIGLFIVCIVTAAVLISRNESSGAEIYSIGEPSDAEQYYVELLNQSRLRPLASIDEMPRIVHEDVRPFIRDRTQWYIDNGCASTTAQPLAINADLMKSAELHSRDLIDSVTRGHVSSQDPPPPFSPGDNLGNRLNAINSDFIAFTISENVGYSASVVDLQHAQFVFDSGLYKSPLSACFSEDFSVFADVLSMHNPASHHLNILFPGSSIVGVGIEQGDSNSHQFITVDFAGFANHSIADLFGVEMHRGAYLTGVVYDDLNEDRRYSLGEGLGGIEVSVPSLGRTAITASAGGWSIPVDEDGIYVVTFTGDAVGDHMTIGQISMSQNTKVDYIALDEPSSDLLEGDFNLDGQVDIADFMVLADGFNSLGSYFDGDMDFSGYVDLRDFASLRGQFPSQPAISSVPEPRDNRFWLLIFLVTFLWIVRQATTR